MKSDIQHLFYLIDIYLPQSGNKLQHLEVKVVSLQWFIAFACRLDVIKPVIICGDLNVGNYFKDTVHRKKHKASAGFNKQEKSLFRQLLDSGFTDVFSHQYKSEQ